MRNEIIREEEPESFMDIAKICVKKKNKGPFDELVTSAYRLRKLIEFYPRLDTNKSNKEKLAELIKKGLNFKNFNEFKEEFMNHIGFQPLKESKRFNDYYATFESEFEQQDLPFEKFFLTKMQNVINESVEGLKFLKSFVDKQIEEEEAKLKLLSK